MSKNKNSSATFLSKSPQSCISHLCTALNHKSVCPTAWIPVALPKNEWTLSHTWQVGLLQSQLLCLICRTFPFLLLEAFLQTFPCSAPPFPPLPFHPPFPVCRCVPDSLRDRPGPHLPLAPNPGLPQSILQLTWPCLGVAHTTHVLSK